MAPPGPVSRRGPTGLDLGRRTHALVEHVRLVPQLRVLAKVLPYHLHPLHLQPLQLLRPGSHLWPSPRASAPAGRLPATLPTQPASLLRALTSAPPFQLHIFLTSFLRSAPPGFSGWFPHCGGGGSRPMALWGPSRDCLSLCFFFNSLSCV